MTVKAKAYIGAKIIVAHPHEKDGVPGYRVVYPDGYVSWSPKETFEGVYREVTEFEQELVEFPSIKASVAI